MRVHRTAGQLTSRMPPIVSRNSIVGVTADSSRQCSPLATRLFAFGRIGRNRFDTCAYRLDSVQVVGWLAILARDCSVPQFERGSGPVGMTKTRLEAFSDGVVAILITIM